MERKQLDADIVFRNYVVNDTPEYWEKYAGIIIEVRFAVSKDKENDYHCIIVLGLKNKKEEQVFSAQKVYRNIMTESRCSFQELVDDFGIISEDEEGEPCLDIPELVGRYCIASLNTAMEVKNIKKADFRAKEKTAAYADFLDKNTQLKKMSDYSEIPDEVFWYYMFPITFPYDEWKTDYEYYGGIREVTCYDSDNANDVDVKVSVYVFNGGTTTVMAKYFNRIHSSGKEEFDEFCLDFALVDERGNINMEGIETDVCKVILYQNKKGNIYIDTLKPIENVDEMALQQYDLLIENAENNF